MGTQTEIPPHAEKKPFLRRLAPDRSQQIRRVAQGLFVLLNGWLGMQFYLWVRYFERGGTGLYVPRPAGVEGWLPIAGFMNFKYFLVTGLVPSVHPAAMFLFMAFVLMSLLLKKAFCSWLCPVGTVSEYLWKLGQRIFGRALRLPRWVDIPLRGLKYLLLGFFVFVIGSMSAEALQDFMHTSYGMVADVKMMKLLPHHGNHGDCRHRRAGDSFRAGAELLVPVRLPLWRADGAGFAAEPVKIRRDADACINCGKVRHGLPRGPAGGPPNTGSLSGMYRVHGLRCGLLCAGCPSVSRCRPTPRRRRTGGIAAPSVRGWLSGSWRAFSSG